MAQITSELTEADYEAQPHLVHKKGTKVRVTKVYQTKVDSLQRFHDDHINSASEKWRKAAEDCLGEKQAFIEAVGGTFVVIDYFIGANPHIIEVNGIKIGLPAECLEAV